MTGALKDIRILDLSRILAGPFCTQMLGDLGAEIIKVERPETGDDTRNWGPPFMQDAREEDTLESAYYLSTNRNKKSIAIDIKTKEGQALIHALIEKSDVVIENFKVGNLEKYGLSYDQIKDKYPSLIYCSISGFGQNGPLAKEPGYDFLAQAMAGLMASTGEADGAPMKVGVALSDIITGLNAAIGILAALNHKNQTGQGQFIDVALTDCTLAALSNLAQYHLTAGTPAPRLGNAHSAIVPYQAFSTQDGHIIIAVGNDNQFVRFAKSLGHEQWAQDERFSQNCMRVKNREALTPMIENIIKEKTTQSWLDLLSAAHVPCGPVNDMEQVFAMEQTQARAMKINMNHSALNQEISLVGSPLKLSETPVSYEYSPPSLGEHTQEILEKTLGLGAEEIKVLKQNKIIEAK